MKKMNMLGLTFGIFLMVGSLSAQNLSIGAALKGSTMGPGADIVVKFHEKMTARVGFDQLNLGPIDVSFEEEGISYDAGVNVKTGSITALYDFYLAKSVFVSAGVGINNFNVGVNGEAASGLPWGDITIPADKIGEFNVQINPGMKLSPYLGVGFGRTLSSKLVAFAFELGSYYMGGPDLTIESSGLLAPTSMEEFGREELLESQLSQYYLYPVLKFSLSFNIYQF